MMYLSETENKDLKGKVALTRLSTNVSIKSGEIVDDFRLKAMLPTLKFLTERGVRVLAVGHIEPIDEVGLELVAKYYKNFFPTNFFPSCDPEKVRDQVGKIREGEILFLENLRTLPYEKENNEKFSSGLSSLANLYVNDAFPVSHREHCSIVGFPKYLPSFMGLRFQKEVEEISKAFNPQKPFVFIVGGLKFKTKAPLIEKFLEKADMVFVGGALANSFFKQKGWEVGVSATDEGVELSHLFDKQNLFLPIDVVVVGGDGETKVISPNQVQTDDSIVDVGPETIKQISEKIKVAGMVVWNGPMGNFEKGFGEQTRSLAVAVAESECYSLIGGGDTITSLSDRELEKQFSFISTGGGAMLDFLVNENLPGIEALDKSSKTNF